MRDLDEKIDFDTYMKKFLNKYPKCRKELPQKYKEIYKHHIIRNRKAKSTVTKLTSFMESWMHRKVASDIYSYPEIPRTLELGAGTLNHLKYEESINQYDIVEPFVDLYNDSELLYKVKAVYEDIYEIKGEKIYDRIISIAVLEHLCNLPFVVAKAALLLSDCGSFRVAIPNEGGILWKIGWKITTGFEFRLRYGLDYETLMKYEHVNNSSDIQETLNILFRYVRSNFLGLSKTYSFYLFFDCSSPYIERCKEILNSYK